MKRFLNKKIENFVLSVFEMFQEGIKCVNGFIWFSNSNSHYYTTECKYDMMALAQNKDFNVKICLS
jgi:hypothetical protein